MDDTRIDHLLGSDDVIEPSAGFAVAVMEAIRAEPAAPDLLRFPWRLTWPGLAAAAVCLAGSVASLFFPAAGHTSSSSGPDIVDRMLASAVDLGTSLAMEWVVFSCLLTLVTVHMSMQIIRRASL
jgi:hypothetical protein